MYDLFIINHNFITKNYLIYILNDYKKIFENFNVNRIK